MRGRFASYPSYRDSGVNWIGQVPKDWVVLATARVSDLTTGERDTQDAEEDGAYPFFVRSQTVERISSYSFDGEGVLTSGDGAGVGKIFHHYVGKFEFHQRVYLFHNFRRITGRFFFYFFREHLHRVALAGNAKSTVDSLRRPMLRIFPVCLPLIEEQERIVEFLDYETGKMDALIEKQQQLIRLLKEKRQAVISHAVTKGLNPAAPMRDSGIEWLGEVPAHWEVAPIKHQFESQDSRRIPLSTSERGKRQGAYPYYGASGVIDNIDDFIFSEPTILVGEDGANLVNRSTPLAFPAFGQYWVNNHAHILRPPDEAIHYWTQAIEHIDVNPLVTGAAQPKLTAEALLNLKIAFAPSLEERLKIQGYILEQGKKLLLLSDKAKKQVDLLQERRTALISAAVTGKIDVRKWKPPAPRNQTETP